MAFIEPMRRNKPNITYLLTEINLIIFQQVNGENNLTLFLNIFKIIMNIYDRSSLLCLELESKQ